MGYWREGPAGLGLVAMLACQESMPPSLRRYILNVRLRHHGQAEESRALRWVEEHMPGAELQQKSPGKISFSIAQQVSRHCRPCVRFLQSLQRHA